VSPQNPDLDSEALLALPLPQLVQKLHSGDLYPEAVLFTYIGKVRPGSDPTPSSPLCTRLWENLAGGPWWDHSAKGCQGEREGARAVCVYEREREGSVIKNLPVCCPLSTCMLFSLFLAI